MAKGMTIKELLLVLIAVTLLFLAAVPIYHRMQGSHRQDVSDKAGKNQSNVMRAVEE